MESQVNGVANVAQGTLEELASAYVRVCLNHKAKTPLPMEADELSYACLLLCVEHVDALAPTALDVLAKCLKTAREAGHREWMDTLPWRCAVECFGLSGMRATNILCANLAHHSSEVRLFLFEIAWFYRPRLNPRWIEPKLLKNMADTLGGWHRSAGLCASMQESPEAFLALAEEYDAGDFADQFRMRLDYLKEDHVPNTEIYFYCLETSVRKRIIDAAIAAGGA